MTTAELKGQHYAICERCADHGPYADSPEAACRAAHMLPVGGWTYYVDCVPKSARFTGGRYALKFPAANLKLVCDSCAQILRHEVDAPLCLAPEAVERLSLSAVNEDPLTFRRFVLELLAAHCPEDSYPELRGALKSVTGGGV